MLADPRRAHDLCMEYHQDNNIAGYRIIGEPIGRGGFAEVFCAEDGTTGRKVALKRIQRENARSRLPNYEERIQKEVAIHQKLSHPGHPNVVKLLSSFKDPDYVYVVMEYCPHRDMRHYLKDQGPLDEATASRVLDQVARGVKYLHSRDVIHRDLSTGNVLISHISPNDIFVKIGDLGLSTQQTTPNQKHFTVCGTPNFISPEVALSKRGGAGHGKEADIWSLGAFLYTLLNGKPPFGENREASETLKRIIAGKRGDGEETGEGVFSPLAKDLIAGMMNPNVQKRLSIDEVLSHPFLAGQGRRENRAGRPISNASVSSADSGRGSLRGSGFSGPVIHSSRSLDRARSRRISPSPPARRAPFRLNRQQWLPPVPSGRPLPPLPRHQSDYKSQTSGDFPQGSRRASRSPTTTTGHHSACGHSQLNEERCCRRCGRTVSVLRELSMAEEAGRSQGPSVLGGGRCSSFRETGSCRGTCRVLVEQRQNLYSERNRSVENERRRSITDRRGVDEGLTGSPGSPPVVNSAQRAGQRLKPISSERLKPQVEKSGKAMLRILEDGEVCIEFLQKSSSGTELVSEVMRISGNGKKIVIYKPSSDTVVNYSAPPPYSIEKAEHFQSLAQLPEKHHKRYLYASRFVDLLRSKTPKITLYAETSKSILKENGDFEMSFFNGKCGIKKVSGTKIEVTKFGQPTRLTTEEAAEFDSKLSHCRAIEHALEALTGTGNPCFPVILGRRIQSGGESVKSTPRTPHSAIQGERKGEDKENTALLPLKARKPPTPANVGREESKEADSGQSYRGELNTKFNCTTERDSEGSYKISFHETGEVLWLGKDGNLEFRGKDGERRRYNRREARTLPGEVQGRFATLLQIIKEGRENIAAQ